MQRLMAFILALLVAVSVSQETLAASAEIAPEEGNAQSEAPAPKQDADPTDRQPMRGLFFNPRFEDGEEEAYYQSWLIRYPQYRERLRAELDEIASMTGLNTIAIYIAIPFSLKDPSKGPQVGQSLAEWANIEYLDNLAAFVDDCHEVDLSIEMKMACNLWMPYSVDTENHVANSGKWPKPSETPWVEAAIWYKEVINYVEGKAAHPESIAVWVMTGNYQLGGAEPCLWPDDTNPAVLANTEKFVKYVWPVFSAAGKRPKGSPYMFGIFSNVPYWMEKSPEDRLAGFYNLKKWIADDLGMLPDYWMITAYPCCDPAPDGFHYLKTMVDILHSGNTKPIIATDLKGPGHEPEYKDTILSVDGYSGVDLLEWHFDKFEEYGIQHWWIWAYMDISLDAPWNKSGIRDLDGEWKMDLVQAIREETEPEEYSEATEQAR